MNLLLVLLFLMQFSKAQFMQPLNNMGFMSSGSDLLIDPSNGHGPNKCLSLDVAECRRHGYATSMPNRFQHETIDHALEHMKANYAMIMNINCSPHLNWFVCLLYFPVCVENWDKSVQPCRSMCELVKKDCMGTLHVYGQQWPAQFDCSLFQENNECVSVPDEAKEKDGRERGANGLDKMHSEKCEPCSCRPPFVLDSRTPYNNVVTGSIPNCQPSCLSPLFESDPDRSFATFWMGFWAIACTVSTLMTLLTYAINTKRFDYPQRPIIFLSACYLMVSIGYLIRVFMGHKAVACDAEERLVMKMTGSTQCSAVFLFTYLFGMAAAAWWVILTFTWFLASGLKWSSEAIAKYSQSYHFVAWFFPGIQSLIVLTMSGVEGDPVGGLCYTGTISQDYQKYFVILPLVIYLSLGTVFLIGGFMALVKIRSAIKLNPNSVFFKSERIENLMIKIGLFGLFYTIPSAVILGCNIYEYYWRDSWYTAYNCPCNNNDDRRENVMTGKYSVYMLKYFMSLMIGVTSSIWIWSGKTLRSWAVCLRLRKDDKLHQGMGMNQMIAYGNNTQLQQQHHHHPGLSSNANQFLGHNQIFPIGQNIETLNKESNFKNLANI